MTPVQERVQQAAAALDGRVQKAHASGAWLCRSGFLQSRHITMTPPSFLDEVAT